MASSGNVLSESVAMTKLIRASYIPALIFFSGVLYEYSSLTESDVTSDGSLALTAVVLYSLL